MKNIFKPTPENIKKAAELIKNGGIIAVPTDTVYGISADVYNMKAVARVFNIKGRDFTKPMITLIDNIKDLPKIAETNEDILKIAKAFWPGPLTLLLNRVEATPELDLVCTNLRKITIRIPDNRIMLEVLKHSQTPLISTSANLSGQPAALNAEEVFAQIGDQVDMILDGGKSLNTQSSTILDLSSPTPKILRQGAITIEEIEKMLISSLNCH